jgi:hypothetical protein
MIGFRVEEPICKVTVGECHPKKKYACLEPFKAHFESMPFLRQGGDALRGLKSSLVIGQKAQIGPNPFTPRGWANLVV